MKLAFISTYPPEKCGVADYTKELNEAIQKHDTEVIAPQGGDHELSYSGVGSLLKEIDPDIVHLQHELNLYGRLNFLVMTFSIMFAKLFTDFKVVTTVHTYIDYEFKLDKKQLMRIIGYKILTFSLINLLSDEIIVHSQHIKQKMPYDAEVIPHGVKLSNGNNVRDKYGYSEDDLLLLCVGFISEGKGLHRAIEAVNNTEAKLLIAGSSETDYLQSLKEKAGNNVQIVDKYLELKEIENLMSSADAVLFPYEKSCQSGMMHRAIGAGCCIIASGLPPFKELLGDRAIFFDSTQELNRRIVDLDEDKINRYEEQSRQFREKLSWNRVAQLHETIYF